MNSKVPGVPQGYMIEWQMGIDIPEGWLLICEDNREALEEVFDEEHVSYWLKADDKDGTIIGWIIYTVDTLTNKGE